ncbi:MAG: tRNA (guanine37-N1)-methyltransferase [Flavobacteriaceae bacterium]|jgi:tRNA (guanine37-N1)-methyltransferase
MRFHIITIFPELFESYCKGSIVGRAVHDKKIKLFYYNPRDYSKNKHKNVDDIPYGGGPGMVMKAEPILSAYKKALSRISRYKNTNTKTYLFAPRGDMFDEQISQECSSSFTDIILICGRYEGIDSRVLEITQAQELSIGSYVLSGGELPAMVVIDSVSRKVPGVLGNSESLEESRNAARLMYTRPESFTHEKKTHSVPEVLLSGNHKNIEQWRKDHM